MTRLRIAVIALAALALTGCPFFWNIADNTIMFTFDGVDYEYAASNVPVTHGWGQGEIFFEAPSPHRYYLTASLSSADAGDLVNTIMIEIDSDGDYAGTVTVYDAIGDAFYFDLGRFTRTELEAAVENLDAVGEQMRAGFEGPLTFTGLGTHTLEKLAFSLERLPDYTPSAE